MCARPWITLVIVQIDYNVLIIKLFVVGHLKMHREDIFGRIFMTILRNGKGIKQGSLSVCAVGRIFCSSVFLVFPYFLIAVSSYVTVNISFQLFLSHTFEKSAHNRMSFCECTWLLILNFLLYRHFMEILLFIGITKAPHWPYRVTQA